METITTRRSTAGRSRRRAGQTILEVVREHELDDIPTLCHSPELEPYGSCFLCVVEVEGRPNLVPACATRVAAGHGGDDAATTASSSLAQDRARAPPLEPLRRLRLALHGGLPGGRRRPGLHRAVRDGRVPEGGRPHPRDEPAAGGLRPRLRAQVRGRLPPRGRRRAGRHQRDQALRHRPARRLRRGARARAADGQDQSGSSAPGPAGLTAPGSSARSGYDPVIYEAMARTGRHAPLRHPRVPAARRRARPRGRVHLPRGRRDQVRHAGRQGRHPRRAHEEARRRVPRRRAPGPASR